jgi:PAS domain S-box-containing protein/putative nucleotidyltransferase with HDIG domain
MAKARILIVEDDNIVVLELRDRLQRLGYAAVGAASYGQEAIARVAEMHPDLVLMDIGLKGTVDGVEAAQEIRTRFDIPVVYLTAYANEDTLQRAKITEPYGYVVKPFQERELHTAIEIALYKHKTEETLRQSEKRFRQLVENANDIIYTHDLEGNFTSANPAATRIYGYTIEEILHLNITQIVDPEYLSLARQKIREKLEGSPQSEPYELLTYSKEGESIWVEVSTRLLEGQSQSIGVMGIARDITERKQVDKALQESEARYRQLVKYAPVAIYEVDMTSGKFLSVNDVMCQYLGYSREELLTMDTFSLIADESGKQLATERWTKMLAGEAVPETAEYKISRKDGGEIWGLVNTRVRYEGGKPAVAEAVAHDITERKQAEEALRQHAAQLEALRQVGLELTAQLDLDALLLSIVSRAVELVKGVSGGLYLYRPEEDALEWAVAVGPILTPIGTFLCQGEGLSGKVWETGEPLIVDDYQAWEGQAAVYEGYPFRALVGVPVHWGDEFLGVLDVRADPPHTFSPADAELLSLFATQAAIAIRNARLHEETRRRLEYMRALRSVDTAITASMDLHPTLNTLLDQAISQLQVDAATVLLFNPHMQTLEHAAGRGFRTDALQHTSLRLGEGQAGRAALEHRMVSITDLHEARNAFARAPLLDMENFVAYFAVPLIAKGQIKGVLEIFHRAPLDPDEEWLNFLEALATQAAIALDNATLFADLQRANVELTQAYDTTLAGWAHALELRDKETKGHTERVTDMALRLARAMGMRDEDLTHLRRGALLHDIGKMAIPDAILHKHDSLTDEEREIMREHPVYAYEMLSPIAYLRQALDIPYCHHERWNGTGYPRGLKGENIPLAARIFAVVDVWEALLSDRPYRAAWPEDKVIEYIREQAGKQFDPKVVEAFLGVLCER